MVRWRERGREGGSEWGKVEGAKQIVKVSKSGRE